MLISIVLVVAAAAAACSNDDDQEATGTSTSASAGTATTEGDVAGRSGAAPPVPAPTVTVDATTRTLGGTDAPIATPPVSTTPVDTRCDTADADAPHEIVLWHAFSGAARTHIEEQAAAFNAMQTGTTITLTAPDNYWELLDDFNSVPADELPDIMIGNEDSVEALARTGVTVPPTACTGGAPFDDLLPVAEATYTIDGQLVAVPYAVSSPVLYYDAAAFTAAGLDPSTPPATLDELRSASDRIVESGVATHGLIAYDQYGGWLLRQGAAQRGDVLLEPDNGRGEAEDLVVVFDSAESVAALQWLADGVTAGSFHWIGGNTGQDDFYRLVADDGAMTLHTSAALAEVITAMEAEALADRQLAVAPFPGPAVGGLVGGGSLWLVDHGDPGRVGAAWDVVEWLMEPAHLAALDAATGYVPVRDAVLDEPVLETAWAEHPVLRVAYDQLAAMDGDPASAGMLARPLVNLLPMTNEAATRAVGGEDPAAVLADIGQQFQSMLLLEG